MVERFAKNQKSFFDQFELSMVKMGQIKVLTGWQGEIRAQPRPAPCCRRGPSPSRKPLPRV
jgi:hypothetical protein